MHNFHNFLFVVDLQASISSIYCQEYEETNENANLFVRVV